jgi:TonB family protein
MYLFRNIILECAIGAILCVSVFPQSTSKKTEHFEAEGIAFDYTAGWMVSDKSTETAHQFFISREGSVAEVMIIVPKAVILRERVEDARRAFTEPLIKQVELRIAPAGKTLDRVAISLDIAGQRVEGVRLEDSAKKEELAAEIYGFRLHLRWINLVLFRAAKDQHEQITPWQDIVSTLAVARPVVTVATAASSNSAPKESRAGILNGQALSLPRPDYPPIARVAHASGTVVVQVVIDESGKVISAAAVAGHPLLQGVSVAAAKQAKFTPTLLEGEPVKVTGVIHYNFVPK